MNPVNNTVKSICADIGLLLIRMMIGVVFIFHGAQKLFSAFGGGGMEKFTGFIESLEVPMPLVSAWAAALSEFGGGILLLIGLASRIVAVPMAFTMAIAVFMVHNQAFSNQNDGMEYPLTLGVVLIGLMLTGPGRFSLDGLIHCRCGKKKPKSE